MSDVLNAVEPSKEVQAVQPDARSGEEFRNDLRDLPALAAAGQVQTAMAGANGAPSTGRVGSGNSAARRVLSADELAPLTQLSVWRSVWAIGKTAGLMAVCIAAGVVLWGTGWVLVPFVVLGLQQHALFILSHEAAHYRLLPNRSANDALGRLIGMSGGVSMLTYRVTHRLHHNHLYTAQDPDTAIHGGYPRGNAYLWRKLLLDLTGWNAWKTYAYYFGSPAISSPPTHAASLPPEGERVTVGIKIRPLNDTSPELRAAAQRDRWWVVGFQVALPLLFWAGGGATALLIYCVLWLLPLLTVLQPILRLRAICEHGGVTDLSSPLTAARSNRTFGGWGNRLAGALLFPHHVNHHLEHHLYPAVPHYHLPKLHQLLLAKGALNGAEVRDVGSTFKLIFAPRHLAPTLAAAPTSLPPEGALYALGLPGGERLATSQAAVPKHCHPRTDSHYTLFNEHHHDPTPIAPAPLPQLAVR